MKHAIYLFLLFSTFSLTAQEFSISKEAITFPNGKTLSNPMNSPVPIPGGGSIIKMYAQFSNGISGSITHQDYIGHVELFGFNNHLFRETDDAGRPLNNGDVKKDQVIIYKKIDLSSVALLQNFSNNGIISEVNIKMIVPDNQGSLVTKFTLRLFNIKIIQHRYFLEFDESNDSYYFYEKYNLHVPSFEFKNIDANQSVTIN